MLRKADLHKLQAELLTCLPSLPYMPDLHKLRDGLLRSPSNWHIIDLLHNCLPERFSHSNHTDVCVLVRMPYSTTGCCIIIRTHCIACLVRFHLIDTISICNKCYQDEFAWLGIHKSIVECASHGPVMHPLMKKRTWNC